MTFGVEYTIVNGEITPINITEAGKYKLGYSSECKEKSCSNTNNASIEYTFNSNNSYIAKDGASMSDIDISNKKIV